MWSWFDDGCVVIQFPVVSFRTKLSCSNGGSVRRASTGMKIGEALNHASHLSFPQIGPCSISDMSLTAIHLWVISVNHCASVQRIRSPLCAQEPFPKLVALSSLISAVLLALAATKALIKHKTGEDDAFSKLSYLWASSVAFIISKVPVRFVGWCVPVWRVWKARSVTEKQPAALTEKRWCLICRARISLVGDEYIKEKKGSRKHQWSAETRASIWGSETHSDILVLLIIVRVWVRRDATIAVFVWCSESHEKCCRSQRTEVPLSTNRVPSCCRWQVLQNNAWVLASCPVSLSNCWFYFISLHNFWRGAQNHLIPFKCWDCFRAAF